MVGHFILFSPPPRWRGVPYGAPLVPSPPDIFILGRGAGGGEGTIFIFKNTKTEAPFTINEASRIMD